MKKELTYIHDLDTVLHILTTNPYINGFIAVGDKWAKLKACEYRMTDEMTDERLTKILNKLIKDDFVEQYNEYISNGKVPVVKYKISFNGLVQDELGGYKSIYLKNNKLKIIQKRLYYLTIIIAIGAGVASIYYLNEIAKYFLKM